VVEPLAPVGVPRAGHAVAVVGAGADSRQVHVPRVGVDLLDRDAGLGAGSFSVEVEQAQVDGFGLLGEHCEVGALPVPVGSEWRRATGPDLDGRGGRGIGRRHGALLYPGPGLSKRHIPRSGRGPDFVPSCDRPGTSI